MVRTLDEVRHVPNLRENLTSLTILDSKGYKCTGKSKALKVYKGTYVVLEGSEGPSEMRSFWATIRRLGTQSGLLGVMRCLESNWT